MNHAIGVDGDLPWRLPADLKRFKAITMGKPIVMGRLTWESIGRPLPGRHNIILTRQKDFSCEGCDVVCSPAAALQAAGNADEIMIIGGAQIYDLFLPKAQRIYLTRVHCDVAGDAYFTELDAKDWELVNSQHYSADDINEFAFDIQLYERADRSQR